MNPSLKGLPGDRPPALQGALDSVRLPAIVGLLAARLLSGRLAVTDDQRGGAILLQEGRLAGATCGPAKGRDALVLLALSSPQGRFTFTSGAYGVPEGAGLDGDADRQLPPLDLLIEVDRRRETLRPLLTAGWAPIQAPTPSDRASGATPTVDVLQLDRATLGALMAIHRGSREPLAIGGAAGIHDLLQTAAALERLQRLRLIRPIAQASAPPSAPAGKPSATPAGSPETPAAGQGPAPFVPSTVWQVVPSGTAVPPGGEYRLELGGLVYARWPAAALPAALRAALPAAPPEDRPANSPAPEPPAPKRAPPAPVRRPPRPPLSLVLCAWGAVLVAAGALVAPGLGLVTPRLGGAPAAPGRTSSTSGTASTADSAHTAHTAHTAPAPVPADRISPEAPVAPVAPIAPVPPLGQALTAPLSPPAGQSVAPGPTAVLGTQSIDPHPQPADLAGRVTAAAAGLRSGRLEATVGFSDSDRPRSAAVIVFDLGDGAAPPRLRIISTYPGAEGQHTVERVQIGAAAWERSQGGRWAPATAASGAWHQVHAYLPHLPQSERTPWTEVIRAPEATLLRWHDSGYGADAELAIDASTGTPRRFERRQLSSGAVLEVHYPEWNTPVEIAQPGL